MQKVDHQPYTFTNQSNEMSSQLWIIVAMEESSETVIFMIIIFDEKKFTDFNALELQ